MYIVRSGTIYEIRNGIEVEFISPFAQEYFDQELSSHERGAWKRGSAEDGGLIPRGTLWGARAQAAAPSPPKATYVFERKSRLYYVLQMSNSNGLFYFDFDTKTEMRLFHRVDFDPRGLYICDDFTILTTVSNPDGSVHLTHLDSDGQSLRTLTSGDCIDENPVRLGDSIIYQSTGIARADGGAIAAMSPAAIHRLDMVTGDVVVIHSSPDHDLLLPRPAADGSVYCIETPYTRVGGYSFATLLMDVVLFPWRMCVALFGFLNVFSMFFGKKSLRTTGGPQTPEVDISRRMVHHRLLDLQEAQRKERKRVAVPRSWRLGKIVDGRFTPIAANVLWYALTSSGAPTYTDGYAVYDAKGTRIIDSEGLIITISGDAAA